MNRALVATVLLTTLAATGCTDSATGQGSDRHTGAASRSASPTTSATDAAQEPLILHGDGGTTCHTPSSPRDLAIFDVTWEATTDLDSLQVRLTDSHGVHQVGGALNVPPVNFGGRIDYSGQSSWAGHVHALDNRWLMWPEHGAMWSWSPTKGETGLAVLHVRAAPPSAGSDRSVGFDGVTASYRTRDGVEGSTTIHDRNVFRRHC